MNEFEINVNPEELEQLAAEEMKKPQTVVCNLCGKEVAAKKDGSPRKHDCTPPDVDVKLSATPQKDSKSDWVTIEIDQVEGRPDYEVVGVNGKVYQIKRGEPVKVPPEVVCVLENAIATRTVQKSVGNGVMKTDYVDYNVIPWRRV